MRSSGITVFNRDFQRLHSIHSTRRIQGILPVLILHPEDKRALRVILHTEGKEIFYPVYKAFQPQDLPQAFSSTRTFQSFQTFQSFMTFQPYNHLYTFQHLPVHQYLPVLSSVSSISRDSTCSSISLIRMQILHTDWFPPETPLSTNRIQDILQTLHSSKKGRCCDIGHTLTYLQNRI